MSTDSSSKRRKLDSSCTDAAHGAARAAVSLESCSDGAEVHFSIRVPADAVRHVSVLRELATKSEASELDWPPLGVVQWLAWTLAPEQDTAPRHCRRPDRLHLSAQDDIIDVSAVAAADGRTSKSIKFWSPLAACCTGGACSAVRALHCRSLHRVRRARPSANVARECNLLDHNPGPWCNRWGYSHNTPMGSLPPAAKQEKEKKKKREAANPASVKTNIGLGTSVEVGQKELSGIVGGGIIMFVFTNPDFIIRWWFHRGTLSMHLGHRHWPRVIT
jgi:hypothetical protein